MKRVRKKPTAIELEIADYVQKYNEATEAGKDGLKCVVWAQFYKWDQILKRIEG
jgi:hypothetical protein